MADANQLKYLQNMAAGKTAKGGAANAGQQSWATQQLAKIPQPTTVPSPTNYKGPTPPIPKPVTVPSPSSLKPSTANIPIPTGGTVPPVQDTSKFSQSYPPIPQDKGYVPTPPQQSTTFSNPQYNDWMAKQSEAFANLEKLMNTPFNYDPNKDAALQSQKVLYDQAAAKASQNSLEMFNDRGIMGSSMNREDIAQIQQNASHQFNALIPQYQQQAYNQYQNRLANAGQLLANAMQLRNNQFNEATTEAELTGSYMPAGAQQLVNQIYNLKSQAETKGITAQERAVLSQQADQIRSQLQAMNVDISGLGADTSLANTRVGQRTLAGQQLDYNMMADQRDYDRGVLESDRDYNEGVRRFDEQFGEDVRRYDQDFQQARERYAVADSQWKAEFDERVKQNGIDAAISWAQVGISRQNANTSAGQLKLSQDRFKYDKKQDANKPASSTSSSTTKIDSKKSTSMYYDMLGDLDQLMNKTEANQYVEYYKDQLTDTDYKNLLKAINEKF